MVNFGIRTIYASYQTIHPDSAIVPGTLRRYTGQRQHTFRQHFLCKHRITTHDNNGNLLPNALRIQYDVDSDGRVQNVKILESTTTPEFEHKIIEKMMSKWRFEKGKPGIAKRVVVMSQPKSTGGPANKQ